MKKFLAVIMMVLGLGMTACEAREPLNPDFDPATFRFDMVKTHKEFAQFARAHFPIGTSRGFVEKILVEGAHAAITAKGDFSDLLQEYPRDLGTGRHNEEALKNFKAHKYVVYAASGGFKSGYGIRAFYDASDNLMLMSVSGILVHNPNQGE